jgi:hypothetical protein
MTAGELTGDQTADPGKCGSCEWFKRNEYIGPGRCLLVLPPHAAIKEYPQGKNEDWRDPALTYDTGSCSFYRSANVEYTKKIFWTVPQNVLR